MNALLKPGKVSLLYTGFNSTEDTIKCILEDSTGQSIILFDCGVPRISIDVLASGLRDEILNNVRYSQCFDLEGLKQSVDDVHDDVRVLVLVNVKQCLNRDKVTDFNVSHKILNSTMMKCRRLCISSNITLVIVEQERDYRSTSNILKYYADITMITKNGAWMPLC